MSDKLDIIKRLDDAEMCTDAIDDAIAEIKRLRGNLIALTNPLPCGHDRRFVDRNLSGAEYCVMCRWNDACAEIVGLEIENEQQRAGSALLDKALADLEKSTNELETLKNPKPCTWTYTDDDYNTWDTACGESFQLEELDPAANNMHFCMYCGKPIKADDGSGLAEEQEGEE